MKQFRGFAFLCILAFTCEAFSQHGYVVGDYEQTLDDDFQPLFMLHQPLIMLQTSLTTKEASTVFYRTTNNALGNSSLSRIGSRAESQDIRKHGKMQAANRSIYKQLVKYYRHLASQAFGRMSLSKETVKQSPEHVAEEVLDDLDKTPEEVTELVAIHIVLPFVGIFLVALVASSVLGSWHVTRFLPDSAVTILVSVILGNAFLRAGIRIETSLIVFADLFSVVMNLALLPIIMFNGGWALDKMMFFCHIEHILIFALLGTAITIVMMGYGSYLTARFGLHDVIGVRENFVFGAFIAATDPVATLATYSRLKMPNRAPYLNALVSGESLINDAIALVMFHALNASSGKVFLAGINLEVIMFFLGSSFFGLVLACGMICVMRLTNLVRSSKHTTLYILLSAYLIYALSEAVGLSGIIANVWAGIVFKRYGAKLLSVEEDFVATEHFEITSLMADNIVFIFCGLCTGLIKASSSFYFGIIASILCIVSRSLMIVICSAMSNFIRSRMQDTEYTVSWKDQTMMVLSGLRGGIALVCALSIDTTWCSVKDKTILIEVTFVVICILLVTCGSATEVALKRLGIVPADDEGEHEDHAPLGSDEWRKEFDHPEVHPNERGRRVWSLLYPILVGKPHESRQQGFMVEGN